MPIPCEADITGKARCFRLSRAPSSHSARRESPLKAVAGWRRHTRKAHELVVISVSSSRYNYEQPRRSCAGGSPTAVRSSLEGLRADASSFVHTIAFTTRAFFPETFVCPSSDRPPVAATACVAVRPVVSDGSPAQRPPSSWYCAVPDSRDRYLLVPPRSCVRFVTSSQLTHRKAVDSPVYSESFNNSVAFGKRQ